MNFKYKGLSKKMSQEAINKFYLEEKNIFQKKIQKIITIFFFNQLI